MNSWILVGMMGAGKTTLGRALAERSGRTFKDTDQMLQLRLGRAIAQIFQVYGEPTFRDHESNVLKGLESGPFVVSTGGGIVLRPENWVEMRRLGLIIYLRAAPEILIERLEKSKKKRPLLDTEDWETRLKELLEEREPLYQQADVVIELNDVELDNALDRVWEVIQERELT